MSDPIRKPDEFPSRSESILSDTIGLEGYSIETPPRSRIEKLLIELKEIIDQGGGSSTAYATSLEITMDEYFVMSATLKNKDGDTLGQVQTVDLPLESVVVNGSYDSINKNVVLTLENGNTVSFSVADLVSGLQTEITSNNKLDADLVDDTNSTHKFTTASDISKLAGIEEQANKTTIDDALSGSSTNPVQNKVVKTALDSKADTSDIPTVPITAIQKNGTGITPVSGTVNITVPTQASDINAATAIQGVKADTAIQGIKVNSSTVNPDSNKVVSITVPTSAADVSALPDTTKYGVALSLTINSSTYVMTGQLKDQNGDNLGTAQTIDLPLESVVVGGSYNSQTKKVVLTLQNGNTIEFSVADLVSGLQTELSASNKLNAAYINYDSTHRSVSDTEKSTWNGKQDALTTAQLAAANSGIDSTKVAQIETNKNNISCNTNNGVKNRFDFDTWSQNITVKSGTKTVSGNSITITATANDCFTAWRANEYPVNARIPVSAGETVVFTWNTNAVHSKGQVFLFSEGDTTDYVSVDATAKIITHTIPSGVTFITIRFGVVTSGDIITYSDIMVRSSLVQDSTYQPYAMSNAELTAKEQQNKNNISYNTDNGVKNTFDFANAPQEANFYTTVSKTATSLTVTANNPGVGSSSVVYSGKNYPAGDYIFSCKITDYSCTTETAKIYIATSTAAGTGVANKTITGNGSIQIPFHWNGGKVYIKYFPNESNTVNQSNTFTASENMIMRASISDTTYQPYAMSNAELTAAEKQNENNILSKAITGTCNTAAATAAKEVSIDGFVLVKGAIIGVKFGNTNSAANVTLNVNSTGAKSIYHNNAVYTGVSYQICGKKDTYTYYMYDGTYWCWLAIGENTAPAHFITTDTSTSITITGLDSTYNTNCILLCTDRRTSNAVDSVYFVSRYNTVVRIAVLSGDTSPTATISGDVITISNLRTYQTITVLAAETVGIAVS